MVQAPTPRKRMKIRLAAKRAFSLFTMALMLASIVPQPALAQTPPEMPGMPMDISNLEIRIEEEVASTYNASARLNTSATGRVIVNNTENRTLTNVLIRLNSTTATSLDINNTIPVAELPPGERTVATYNITTSPRLSLNHEWRSITYAQTVEDLFQKGNISGVAQAIAADPHRLLHGVDNLLEFNVTVANVGARDLVNVTLADLLPNQTVNGSLVPVSTTANVSDPYGGALAYDNASDSFTIPTLRNNTSTRLTFRATLPAAAFGSPDEEALDLRHEIRATYTLETVATQELGRGGLTPVQQRRQEGLKLALEADDTQRRIQESLDVTELTQVVGVLQSEAWSLPSQMRFDAVQRAKALGIPLDNVTFFRELQRQVEQRIGEVLPRTSLLTEQFRAAHEAKVEEYAKIAGSIHKQGAALAKMLADAGIDINDSLRQEAFQRIAAEGYTEDQRTYLRSKGFNDSQIDEMRNFTAQNVANLTNLNVTGAYDQLRDAYVKAIRDSANVSAQVLQNSMSLKRQGNLTRPLTLENSSLLEASIGPAQAALDAHNWGALEPAAKELAKVTFNLGLETGLALFSPRYRNATLAWAAAQIALSGDNETAASMVQGLRLESHFGVSLVAPEVSSHQTVAFGQAASATYRISKTRLEPVTFTVQGIAPLGGSARCDSLVEMGAFEPSKEFSCRIDSFPSVGNFRLDVTVSHSGEFSTAPSIFVNVVSDGGAPGPTPTPPPPPPDLPPPAPGRGNLVAVGEAVDGAGNIVPTTVTINVLNLAGGGYGSRTSPTGRAQLTILNETAGAQVKVEIFCPETTPTHTRTGSQDATGSVPSGNFTVTVTARCTYVPKAPPGALQGVVADVFDRPITGAKVDAARLVTFTSEGFYGLSPPAGEYAVFYLLDGAETEVQPAFIQVQQITQINVVLRHATGGILGNIARFGEDVILATKTFFAWAVGGLGYVAEAVQGCFLGEIGIDDKAHGNLGYFAGYMICGLLPGIGSILDIKDAVVLLFKGDFAAAGATALFATPLAGDVAQVGFRAFRFAAKHPGLFGPVIQWVRGAVREIADGVISVLNAGKRVLNNLEALPSLRKQASRIAGETVENSDEIVKSVNKICSGACSVTDIRRFGKDVEVRHLDDPQDFVTKTGGTLGRGSVGEGAADIIAAERKWIPAPGFSKGAANSPGLDRVYLDPATGRFKIIEAKEVTIRDTGKNIDAGVLDVEDEIRQFSDPWTLDRIQNNAGGKLSPELRQQLLDALAQGNVDKELIVVRRGPVSGATISRGLATEEELNIGRATIINVGDI